MAWLLENAAEISESPTPQFVFAHILVPHAPFFLDASCERAVEYGRSGVNFFLNGVTDQVREEHFFDQLECVNGFVVELANLVQPDDIVIFVGDHGTDRRDQQNQLGASWDTAAIVERMNVFAAIRAGSDCTVGDEMMLPELMKRVLSCVGSVSHPEPDRRMFLTGVFELDRATVYGLVGAD